MPPACKFIKIRDSNTDTFLRILQKFWKHLFCRRSMNGGKSYLNYLFANRKVWKKFAVTFKSIIVYINQLSLFKTEINSLLQCNRYVLLISHNSLAHFSPIFYSYTPWKRHKSFLWIWSHLRKKSLRVFWCFQGI